MRIDKVYIKNFRNIVEGTFAIHSNFTIVIGNNGQGKSTIIHAFQVVLGGYLQCISGLGNRTIHKDEVRTVRDNDSKDNLVKLPTEIKAIGRFSELINTSAKTIEAKREITWTRRSLKLGVTTRNKSEMNELMSTVDL